MSSSQVQSKTSASELVIDASQQWTPPAPVPSNDASFEAGPPEQNWVTVPFIPTTNFHTLLSKARTEESRRPSNANGSTVGEMGQNRSESLLGLERRNDPSLQHNLSAGILDNTMPVERSSRASNADGTASRSDSTASEIFSHQSVQSSRPSTNNTSRSSTGNLKNNVTSTSILNTYSGSAALRVGSALAPPSALLAPHSEQEENQNPSASLISEPGMVSPQSTGFTSLSSYKTDDGNNKASLTAKLKFRLRRHKTDDRYSDSFGEGNLTSVDGLSQWQLAGTAKQRWENNLKPAILETMRNNQTAIFGNELEARDPRLECTMIGKSAKQASPLIRITHNKKKICENLAKVVEKLNLVKDSGFWVTHRQAKYFRAFGNVAILAGKVASNLEYQHRNRVNWNIDRPCTSHTESELVAVCGAELVIPESQKRSTIGLVVDVKGRRYALTVAHVFNQDDGSYSHDDESQCDDGSSSLASGSEEWKSDNEDPVVKASIPSDDVPEEEGTSGEDVPEKERASDHDVLEKERPSNEVPWNCQVATDTLPKWASADQQLDWALVELGDYEQRATNETLVPLGPATIGGGFLTSVLSEPPTGELFVVTQRGNLHAVGCGSVSRNEWSIQLKTGEFRLGDSGSSIVDATNGSIYGFLVSGDPLFGNGYIAPAIEISNDIQRTIRTDLQYDNEVRELWPSRQFDVQTLPAEYEMVPSALAILLDAARVGDTRVLKKLLDFDLVTLDQEPLVEAAKRYKELTPIAEIIDTKSTNIPLLEENIHQIAQFYRNAARNAFKGIEFDLNAKLLFLQELLARGVDPKDSMDIEGTALHQAAEDGNLEAVMALVADPKTIVVDPEEESFVDEKRNDCWSPLQLAVREGHTEVVKFLIANGADIKAFNGSENARQDSVLQIAAWQARSSVVKILLDHKAFSASNNGRLGGPLRAATLSASRIHQDDVSPIAMAPNGERESRDQLFAIMKRFRHYVSGSTPTSGSVVWQKILNVQNGNGLVHSGISQKNTSYTATLNWASTILELLVADETIEEYKISDMDLEQAFYVAAEEGPPLLLEVFHDILNMRTDTAKMRTKRSKALCLASCSGELSAVDYLLQKGADINSKDDEGWTALQLASDAGHLRVVERLCKDKSLDPDRRGTGDQSALTCAAGSSKSDAALIVEMLLQKRADPKVKTKRRGNAINLASRQGHERVVGRLIASGVSAELRTGRDGSPLEIAANKGFTAIVKLLLGYFDSKVADKTHLREALQAAAIYGSVDTVRAIMDHNDDIEIKEKLMTKVVTSNWANNGVIDILQSHNSSKSSLQNKSTGSHLRILQKAARNTRLPTFALPLYSPEKVAPPSSIAACLLQHEKDQSLDIPEDLFVDLAERSDEQTVSLLMRKGRELKVTERVLAAATSNPFHGDKVLAFLLTKLPGCILKVLQSTSILKAAVGNQELGIEMLETVLKWIPADSPHLDVSVFTQAAGNPFRGEEIVERLLFAMPPGSKLVVTPEIVEAAAENWCSGDLVIRTLLESKSTTFTAEAAVEIVLGFTGGTKLMDLDRYEVDVLGLLLQREDVTITEEMRSLVLKRGDRKTVELFEKDEKPDTWSESEIERRLIAAASNMDHALEIVEYLLENTKIITLSERLLNIAAETEENEPNVRGNMILTALFKANVRINLCDFENLLDFVVRHFNSDTVEALLKMPDLTFKVTRFTLEAAAWNSRASKRLLEILLQYNGKPPAKSIDESGHIAVEPTSETMKPNSPTQPVDLSEDPTSNSKPGSIKSYSPGTVAILEELPQQSPSPIGTFEAIKNPGSEHLETASTSVSKVTIPGSTSSNDASIRSVDPRVDEWVMISAASNIEQGRLLLEVLLEYCDDAVLTERFLIACVSNRKQSWGIIPLLQNHVDPPSPSSDSAATSPFTGVLDKLNGSTHEIGSLVVSVANAVSRKPKDTEKVEIVANTEFWRPRLTRRIFEAAMRNWTYGGGNAFLQLLKNDLGAILTQDMFLKIVRQHRLTVVKELFANHGSFFSEDTAEDVYAAAASNWDSGVRVLRFVIDENKALAAEIIPRSERISEAVAGNWKCGKSVLELLLRRHQLCITERVLVATAKNPCAGADIMKTILRGYPGPASIDVIKAAAENFACAVPLLKLLLKCGAYTHIPEEVACAAAANGSCGREIFEFLADGNYTFNVTEAVLLACARNATPNRVFMVSPVTRGRDIPMSYALLQQQREKIKNGNELLKPPLDSGGIVCLINMYASRWQECNVLWGLNNGIAEDETWVRREADWVWGTGRGVLLDLLENHWVEGDLVPMVVLETAALNFDAEVVRNLLRKTDKPITERVLLNATSNELYAHEVITTLLAEKRLSPADSITPDILLSAARNRSCGRQLLEELWMESSSVTDSLLDAAIDNEPQGEQITSFLLDKGGKIIPEMLEDAVENDSQAIFKLLLKHYDDKASYITSEIVTNAAANESIGCDLIEGFIQENPTIEIPDDALTAAASNTGCGAKIMKVLLGRKPLREVGDVDDILISAARNPEQAIRLLSMLLHEGQTITGKVWEAAMTNQKNMQVIAFLIERRAGKDVTEEALHVAAGHPDRAVQLLELLSDHVDDFKVSEAVLKTGLRNWKSGCEVLRWMMDKKHERPDITTCLELAVENVGCGPEILKILLVEYQPLRTIPLQIWFGAARNLGCGHNLIEQLLNYSMDSGNLPSLLTDVPLLKAAAENLNWSEQIFRALSTIPTTTPSPLRISEEVVLSTLCNWKSGENTIRLLSNSPRWLLSVTDVLIKMVVQNTPDTPGALNRLLDGVEEFDFPEIPDGSSPFWFLRSLKAVELLVSKCKPSSIPQEMVMKLSGNWSAEALAKVIKEGTEISQEAFLCSTNNNSNNGNVTRLLLKFNPDLVVTEEMLQNAVGKNIELTKTILNLGQKVTKKTLEVAVKQNSTRILKVLLDAIGEMKIPESVLESAIIEGSPKIVQALLEHGLAGPVSEHILCKAASENARLETMKLLLTHVAGNDTEAFDVPQSVVDEAITQASVSIVKYLLQLKVSKRFSEHTWAEAAGQANAEILQVLLEHEPKFNVTDHILKRAVKASNVEGIKLLFSHDPNIKVTERMMERGAKKSVEILKLLVDHSLGEESFTITDRFLERAAINWDSEVIQFVFERGSDYQVNQNLLERVVEDGDVKVLALILEKYPALQISTRCLVAAVRRDRNPEIFKLVLDRAKQQYLLPTEEVLEEAIFRVGPPPPPQPGGGAPAPSRRIEIIKSVVEANPDSLTENVFLSAFRIDMFDIEAFEYLFKQRRWPPSFVQTGFGTIIRQRPHIGKVKFLLEQEEYPLKISSTAFTHAAEHFDELALLALLESPRAKDCPIPRNLLDTILKGTVGWAQAPAVASPSLWTYTKVDVCVYQKVLVLLKHREVEVTARNIFQAENLKHSGHSILQLFLDSAYKAKITPEARQIAMSLFAASNLKFKPKSPPANNILHIVPADGDNSLEEQTKGTVPVASFEYEPSDYSDNESDALSDCSGSSGADGRLDTLSDSDRRSRENERPQTHYSLPLVSLKSHEVAGSEQMWAVVC